MSAVTVTLSDDQVDELLKHELSRDHADLQQRELERRRGEGFPHESFDPEEDAEALKELCRAFEVVLDYYGVEPDKG